VVVRLAVGREGPPITRQRFVEVSLNVRENPQVLLGSGTELAAVPAQLQRAQEVATCVGDGGGLEVDPAERVERFRREQVVPRGVRHGVTGVAEPSRLVGLVAMVTDDGEAAQRLREGGGFPRHLGGCDRGLVRRDGVGHAGGALLRAGVAQQVRRVAPRWNTRPSGWKRTRFTLSDGAVAVMVTGAFSAPAGIDSACGPILMTPPVVPTVCVAVTVGIGVQPSSPVAWRIEPIKLACGGGGTGPSGCSPQPSSAAAVMTSATRLRRVTFMIVLSGMWESSCCLTTRSRSSRSGRSAPL